MGTWKPLEVTTLKQGLSNTLDLCACALERRDKTDRCFTLCHKTRIAARTRYADWWLLLQLNCSNSEKHTLTPPVGRTAEGPQWGGEGGGGEGRRRGGGGGSRKRLKGRKAGRAGSVRFLKSQRKNKMEAEWGVWFLTWAKRPPCTPMLARYWWKSVWITQTLFSILTACICPCCLHPSRLQRPSEACTCVCVCVW